MPKTPPQPNSPTSTHLPPSLPNSPLAKRPKIMAATPKSPLPSSVPLPETPSSTALRSGPNSAGDSDPPLLVKKLSTDATTPTRGSAFAAGYDLYSARAAKIPAHGKGFAETDLAVAVPAGTCKFPYMLLSIESSFLFSMCFLGADDPCLVQSV